MDWISYFNGKKLIIGGILFSLTQACDAVAVFVPALAQSFTDLGAPAVYVTLVVTWATKFFLIVGLTHKWYKSAFGIDAGRPGFGRVAGMALLAMASGLALSFACAGVKAPPQLSPAGDIAWYANKANVAIAALQQVAIDGEAAGVIQRNDAVKIVEATKVAGTAGVELAEALKAGLDGATARAKAVASIRKAVSDLPGLLSPEASRVISPYVQTVLTLLAVL